MTPTDAQFWDRLMPVIGQLEPQERARTFAHIIETTRGRDVDGTLLDRLAAELRQRFGAAGERAQHAANSHGR